MNPDLKEGFVRFQFVVMQLESLCKASSQIVNDEYFKAVDEYKSTDEYKLADKKDQGVLLAMKKQELLTTSIFRNRSVTTPLHLF